MNNTAYQKTQKQTIIGIITSLMQDLQKLAPNPSRPHNNGPLFIKGNANFKVANDHDSMLGGMMMETMLGEAFSEAVSETIGSWACDLEISDTIEVCSAYITDTQRDPEDIAAHGEGTLARLSSKPIRGSFNMCSTMSTPMQRFMDDLPARMKIEHSLAYYAEALNQLNTPHYKADTSPNKPACAA